MIEISRHTGSSDIKDGNTKSFLRLVSRYKKLLSAVQYVLGQWPHIIL